MRTRLFHRTLRTGTLAFAASLYLVCSATHTIAGQEGTAESSIHVEGPTFVAVRVRNVAAATVWYSKTFGLDPKKTLDGAFSIRILGNDTLTVELIEQRGTEAAPTRHFGLFKMGFFVDDVAQTLEQLRALESIPRDEQITVFVDEPLAVRSFLIRDPEGNRLQFFERCGSDC